MPCLSSSCWSNGNNRPICACSVQHAKTKVFTFLSIPDPDPKWGWEIDLAVKACPNIHNVKSPVKRLLLLAATPGTQPLFVTQNAGNFLSYHSSSKHGGISVFLQKLRDNSRGRHNAIRQSLCKNCPLKELTTCEISPRWVANNWLNSSKKTFSMRHSHVPMWTFLEADNLCNQPLMGGK